MVQLTVTIGWVLATHAHQRPRFGLKLTLESPSAACLALNDLEVNTLICEFGHHKHSPPFTSYFEHKGAKACYYIIMGMRTSWRQTDTPVLETMVTVGSRPLFSCFCEGRFNGLGAVTFPSDTKRRPGTARGPAGSISKLTRKNCGWTRRGTRRKS